MRFLGPVTQLGAELVRPHDLHLLPSAADGATPGTIERVTRVGPEVRVLVDTGADGQTVLVTMTRTEFRAIGVDLGSPVWVQAAPGTPTADVDDHATATELQPA